MSTTLLPNRIRFDSYWKYEKKLHQPYDYRHKGLLNRIMSNKIWNTKNPILQACLTVYESGILMVLNWADALWNFHNYRFRNR